jgi:hypothetical protein
MRASWVATLLPLIALAGCGQVQVAQTHESACESGGFAASLAMDTGGAASPLEAAERTARYGVGDRFPLPADGWHVERQGPTDASVRSGNVHLHSITGRDGTWFIDSVKCDAR